MLGEGRGSTGTLEGPQEDTFLGVWSSTRAGKEGKGRGQGWSWFPAALEPVVEGAGFSSTSGDSRGSWAQGVIRALEPQRSHQGHATYSGWPPSPLGSAPRAHTLRSPSTIFLF